MQILILFVLLYCIFPPKNRFSTEKCIFGISPKIIISWRNNLLIRGFLPWKSRKKSTQLLLEKNCNDCKFSSQHSVALAEASNISLFRSGTLLTSHLSLKVNTDSYSPLKVTNFIWYGCLLNLNSKRDIQFSVFWGNFAKTAFFQKNLKITPTIQMVGVKFNLLYHSIGLKALRCSNLPAIMEYFKKISFWSRATLTSILPWRARNSALQTHLVLFYPRPTCKTAFYNAKINRILAV